MFLCKAPIRKGASEEPSEQPGSAVSMHRSDQRCMRRWIWIWTKVALYNSAAALGLDSYFIQPPADHKRCSADTRVYAHRPHRTIDTAGAAFHTAIKILNGCFPTMVGKDGLRAYPGTHFTADAKTLLKAKA